MTAARALEEAARSLLGPGTAVACREIGTPPAPLYRAEEAAIARAVPTRRAEFAAGRAAARAAMQALGQPPAPIPMGADRAPIWPAPLTGSITHAGGLALAALAPRETCAGLGLDLEPDTPLAHELWPAVLCEAERDWLATRPAASRGNLAKRLFSAKEAAYKAQYPRSATLLEFTDISISCTRDSSAFTARFTRPVPFFAQGDTLSGHQSITAGMILSTVRLWGASGN